MKTHASCLTCFTALDLVSSIGARLAVVALAVLTAPFTANGQTVRYRVVPLTELASAQTSCVPTAINANGDVVGYCGAGELDAFAVRWRSNGTVEDLGKWENGTFTHARGINTLGQIVGDGDDGDLKAKALIRRGSGWIDIDGSGGSFQTAHGITDSGVVFGNFSTVGSPATETWDPVFWTYDPDHDRYDRNDLPKPTGTPSTGFSGAFVFAVNRLGVAVGQVASDLVGNRAGLWRNDASHALVTLPTPSGSGSSAAFAVSDDGRAVGMTYGVPLSEHAMLWLNDGSHSPVDLGTLPGDAKSEAYGVNIAGQVVGASFGAVGRGFIYQNGAMTDLTTLLDTPDSAWTVNEPAGINNAGTIIATATLNGVRHPVMLVPFEKVKAAQTISFTLPAGPFRFGDPPFEVNATSTSGLPVTFHGSGACSVVDTTVTIVGVGMCQVTASQGGNAAWEPAAASATLVIAQAVQSIVFDALADRTFGEPPFTVMASGGGSGNPVTFAATGDCTVSGDLVTLTATGSCTITASQAGNGNYLSAVPVSQSFTVAPAPPAEGPLLSPGPQTNREGDRVVLRLVEARVRGEFSASNLPEGLRIDRKGAIRGRVASGAAAGSPYEVIVNYTAPDGISSTVAFSWTILPRDDRQ
jgi:probable HAF family extracellular repeat protein